MDAGVDYVSTRGAAEQLGVSDRRVRALIEQGDLDAVRAGRALLVIPASLVSYAQRGQVASRCLSARMSWAALLTDLGTGDVRGVCADLGLSASEHHRLMNLRSRPPAVWSWLARRRAQTQHFVVAPTHLSAITRRKGVIMSGISELDRYRAPLTARPDTAELYAEPQVVESLIHDCALRVHPSGNLIVHVLPGIDSVAQALAGRTSLTLATTAVDLLESGDARVRRAGFELIRRVIDPAQA